MFRRVAVWLRSLVGQSAASTDARPCEKCARPSAVTEYRPSPGGSGSERHYCEPCAQRTLRIPTSGQKWSANQVEGGSIEVPVEVERIIFSGLEAQVLVLRESNGPRRLSFTLGYFEATAVWWTLKREPCPRPLTHRAWVDTVTALGAEVRSACVHMRRGDTYFAEIRLVRNGSPMTVDARPSDALVVTLRAGVPFLFAEGLLAADATSEPEPGG